MRDMLQKNNPGAKIESTTLPKPGTRGIKHAGKRHPETKVPFESRGFANFDKWEVYRTKIPYEDFFPKPGSGKLIADLRNKHMIKATQQLRSDIAAGRVDSGFFAPDQLLAIQAGKAQIPRLTWDHKAAPGVMGLVEKEIHKETAHIGSIGLFKGACD